MYAVYIFIYTRTPLLPSVWWYKNFGWLNNPYNVSYFVFENRCDENSKWKLDEWQDHSVNDFTSQSVAGETTRFHIKYKIEQVKRNQHLQYKKAVWIKLIKCKVFASVITCSCVLCVCAILYIIAHCFCAALFYARHVYLNLYWIHCEFIPYALYGLREMVRAKICRNIHIHYTRLLALVCHLFLSSFMGVSAIRSYIHRTYSYKTNCMCVCTINRDWCVPIRFSF